MEKKILTRVSMLIATFLLAVPLIPVNAVPTGLVSISPSSINNDFGTSFTSSVMLSNAANIAGYDIIVSFNPGVFTVNSASLSGTLLDPAKLGADKVLILRHQVFPSVGLIRYALVLLGVNTPPQTPNPSASLLNINFQVNDPSTSTATASDYPSQMTLPKAEIVAVDTVNGGPFTLPVTTNSATYMPPANLGLRNVGCRAVTDGFNTVAKGFTDGIFCRVVNNGGQSISSVGTFSWRSLGGVTGSATSAPITLAPGQAGEDDSSITVANANDILIVTGTATRQVAFQDGSVLSIAGPSDNFKIEVNVP